MIKRVLKYLAVVLVALVVLFVIIVGPWPTYGATDVKDEFFYQDVVKLIDKNVPESTIGADVAPLQAGWGKAELTPPIGTPLAGFGDREGKPSTGIHDPVFARALALNDGKDTVVLVGSDMLIVPNNVADIARADVAKETPLNGNDILFNASHTHSSAGAWGPGVVGKMFSGTYDPAIMEKLGHAYGQAIIDAYKALKPAEIAHGTLEVPEYVRNRTRDAGTDNQLKYLHVKQKAGDECYLVSYSAHPTVLGGGNMEFSADYPGYLYRYIESQTGKFAMYMSGPVGSMGPKVDGKDGFERCQIMGEALAKKILDDAPRAAFTDKAEIASVGFPFKTPSIQFRINRNWRLSPFIIPWLGIDNIAWLQGVRVGDLFFYGTPCDMSGEIAVDMKSWAKSKNIDLWVTSFDGDYIGYISPQKYYLTAEPNGDEQYEMYIMSWFGPDQEPFFHEALHHMVEKMYPAS